MLDREDFRYEVGTPDHFRMGVLTGQLKMHMGWLSLNHF
jgi:hypothetical protein